MKKQIDHLQKDTSKLIQITLIILAIGALLSALFLILSQQKIKEIKSVNQEIESITKSTADTNELREYASDNQDQIETINQFFPNQTTIIDVVGLLEELVKKYDPSAVVVIIDKQPIPTANGPAIHFNIKYNASYVSFKELLIELEKVPLIVQVISFDLDNPRNEAGTVQINLRVYVDQNFTQSS